MEKHKLKIMGHEVTVIVSEIVPQELILFVSPEKAKPIEDLLQVSERLMKLLKAQQELDELKPKGEERDHRGR